MKNSWILVWATVLAMFGGGCAPSESGEEIGEVEQETILGCTNCWELWGNWATFDIGDRFACALTYNGGASVYCNPAEGSAWKVVSQPGLNVGWTDAGTGLVPGGGGKAVAVTAPIQTQATVFVLSNNNRIYASNGNLTLPVSSFYTGQNFKGFFEHMSNLDEAGTALSLKDISMIFLPSAFGPSRTLMALSTSGAIYIRGVVNQKWVWRKPVNAGAPWNQIPAGTWLEISHGPVGAYLLSSTNKVFLVGGGTMDSMGRITWDNRWLPLFTSHKIVHVGGPYVVIQRDNETCIDGFGCTEDFRRFYRFDGTIFRPATSVPMVPTKLNDGSMPYLKIVDGGRFVNNIRHFSVFHHFSRAYSWVP
jgi:hypothetical protein